MMGKFGFIIHPISAKRDMARKYPLAAWLPERAVEWLIKHMSARVVSHVTGIHSTAGAEAEGWLVGCPLTTRQFLELDEEFVLGRVIAAAQVAQELGAGVVGLGAFTSVVADAGISVAKGVDIAVTTGNSYTVGAAIEGVAQAARLMGIDPQGASAAVVGATGSVGRVCAHLLSGTVSALCLVGRDRARLERVGAELNGNARVTCSTDPATALHDADMVVTVTSAMDTVIEPEALKCGAVVCDVARPRDVSPRVARERPDVLVIEGGVIEVPGPVEFNFDFGFPPRTAYACMAETMLLALEERYENFSLGRELEVERVAEISALAKKHGFKLAGLRSFERPVTAEQIERVREAAQRGR